MENKTPELWDCPHCGAVNPAGTDRCADCGGKACGCFKKLSTILWIVVCLTPAAIMAAEGIALLNDYGDKKLWAIVLTLGAPLVFIALLCAWVFVKLSGCLDKILRNPEG